MAVKRTAAQVHEIVEIRALPITLPVRVDLGDHMHLAMSMAGKA
jgi:hypothetical protein